MRVLQTYRAVGFGHGKLIDFTEPVGYGYDPGKYPGNTNGRTLQNNITPRIFPRK